MYNKAYILFLFVLSTFSQISPKITPVSFNSKQVTEILEFIDGVRYAVDVFAIRDMNRVTFQIEALQSGVKDANTKKVIGKYKISKKRYTIHELAELERKKKFPTKNRNIMDDVLMQCIEDFGKIVAPFEETVKGLKHFLTDLIEESCRIRGRMDSLLLEWAKCNGNEQVTFEKNIKIEAEKNQGFIVLDEFLTDLKIFFEDLKFNCPKACKQYEQLKKSNVKTRTGDGNS